ncbi:MAG: hypothetical protein FJ044_01355 [Candidatus Cloacimonetes bacterium]|nr:hypothetical protein [Candidatus Cloacimonadota bacterium]
MLGYFIRHASQYTLLLLILAGGILTLFLIHDRAIKLTIAFALTALYLLWAILHHWEEKNLQVSLLLEYLAIAALILWVLISVI